MADLAAFDMEAGGNDELRGLAWLGGALAFDVEGTAFTGDCCELMHFIIVYLIYDSLICSTM